MKWYSVLLACSALIFLLFQSYMALANKRTERQAYRLIRSEENFEIRFYPPALMATVTAADPGTNTSFRRLANYIFGGNAQSQSIAMTSPVHMEKSDQGSKMSFVMPDGMSLDKLPRPNDAGIQLGYSAPSHFAAVTFGGYATEKTIKEKEQQLKNWLTKKGIQATGPFKVLVYNAPYELLQRKNDVLVPIAWVEQ